MKGKYVDIEDKKGTMISLQLNEVEKVETACLSTNFHENTVHIPYQSTEFHPARYLIIHKIQQSPKSATNANTSSQRPGHNSRSRLMIMKALPYPLFPGNCFQKIMIL